MVPDASVAYYRDQQALTIEALAIAVDLWGSRPPADFDRWFDRNIDSLIELVLVAQRRAVETADDYVADVLDELGTPVAADAETVPEGLVGVASDGRELDSLMYGAVITAKGRVAKGLGVAQAWESGLTALIQRVQTQVADAARASTALSIAARPGVGYVRMLNPPSCARCAVLAGKFYRYNRGFPRHPGCDCRHIPARENDADDLRTDPNEYFNSLSTEQQDTLFTKSGAEAIRLGADVSQVVNARRDMSTDSLNVAGWIPKGRLTRTEVYGQRLATTTEGVTRRGAAYRAMSQAGYARRQTDVRNGRRYFQAKAPRLMPEALLEIAEGRDDALRLLKLYGYLT
ncbi:hypothetical protein K3M35_05150 [Rhodococcus sp. DMU2021]|nr:hypothetical protein [Rhodococcus sp. DMU2021]